MIDRLQQSPFLAAPAVTAWDTWFRLRENGRLRDVSVEQTWQRVATALGAAEPANPRQVTRCVDAQSRWQLILDGRILAGAGTRGFVFPADAVAMVNAAAFVESPFSGTAHFAFDTLRETAALAVRCLDNALLLGSRNSVAAANLRVGLTGVADALVLLGKRYGSAAGRVMAARIAQALAEGCLQGSAQLARERGARDRIADDTPQPQPLQLAPGLAAEFRRYGRRHCRLTEISSQPRLASFANNIADALDPIRGDVAASPAQAKAAAVSAVPYPTALARATVSAEAVSGFTADPPASSLRAQIELRGTVQPWIDLPIHYPFRVTDVEAARANVLWRKLACAHRLGDMTLVRI